jgi:hypothetical protein
VQARVYPDCIFFNHIVSINKMGCKQNCACDTDVANSHGCETRTMTKEEWLRVVRVTDQLAFIIDQIRILPENVCSPCYETLMRTQAALIDIADNLLMIDVVNMSKICTSHSEYVQ